MAREYFLAYHSYSEFITELSDAEVGRLFRACLEYSKSGATERLSGAEKYVFPAFRFQIDKDRESYEAKVNSSKENGAKGGRPKNPEVNSETQKTQGFSEKPKKPKEKEKEKEKDKENVIDSPPTPSFEVSKVVSAWNAIDGITKVERIKSNSERYKSCNARITEYGIDKVLQAVNNIPLSDFLMGRKKDWKITFDWFVAPNNFPKVLEGNYTDTKSAVPKGAKGQFGEAELAAIAQLMNEEDFI